MCFLKKKKKKKKKTLKREVLISCANTAQLICVFVIEYAKYRFSHDFFFSTLRGLTNGFL